MTASSGNPSASLRPPSCIHEPRCESRVEHQLRKNPEFHTRDEERVRCPFCGGQDVSCAHKEYGHPWHAKDAPCPNDGCGHPWDNHHLEFSQCTVAGCPC